MTCNCGAECSEMTKLILENERVTDELAKARLRVAQSAEAERVFRSVVDTQAAELSAMRDENAELREKLGQDIHAEQAAADLASREGEGLDAVLEQVLTAARRQGAIAASFRDELLDELGVSGDGQTRVEHAIRAAWRRAVP